MKYKCICLDHDDTVVNSTATIHYPCFVRYLREHRPSIADSYTLESYFVKNFDPGILELLRDKVGLNDEEIRDEEEYWRRYVSEHIPTAYVGISAILTEYRARGGIIAVTSHSFADYIRRDYRYNNLPMPDIIYGWDLPNELRKPSPFAVRDIMSRYSLCDGDILVIDDLKPGYDMARAAGVDFAAAGWAYDVPSIEQFMRMHCDFYLKEVAELGELLLG